MNAARSTPAEKSPAETAAMNEAAKEASMMLLDKLLGEENQAATEEAQQNTEEANTQEQPVKKPEEKKPAKKAEKKPEPKIEQKPVEKAPADTDDEEPEDPKPRRRISAEKITEMASKAAAEATAETLRQMEERRLESEYARKQEAARREEQIEIPEEFRDEVERLRSVDADALDAIVLAAGGDARRALSILELAIVTAPEDSLVDGAAVRGLLAEASLPRSALELAELRSAWIKSMRGGDADAAVYWLERLLRADEDPLFLTRRLLVFMSEDVGMGDARALPLAHAADETVRRVGLPEGRYALVHTTVYAAMTAKSRSVSDAMARVDEVLERLPHEPVPPELHVHGAGVGARPGQRAHGWPSDARHEALYVPSGGGEEARLRERLRSRGDDGG